MQGYWIELFKPRAKADIKAFLPENVEFVGNPSAEKLQELLTLARGGKARVLLECPAEYPALEFGDEIYADSFKARSVVADDWFGLPVCPPRYMYSCAPPLRASKRRRQWCMSRCRYGAGRGLNG